MLVFNAVATCDGCGLKKELGHTMTPKTGYLDVELPTSWFMDHMGKLFCIVCMQKRFRDGFVPIKATGLDGLQGDVGETSSQ